MHNAQKEHSEFLVKQLCQQELNNRLGKLNQHITSQSAGLNKIPLYFSLQAGNIFNSIHLLLGVTT